MGKYESSATKVGVFIGGDILNRAGNAIIDSKVKNPMLNKGSKLILQETLGQSGNRVNDKVDKKYK